MAYYDDERIVDVYENMQIPFQVFAYSVLVIAIIYLLKSFGTCCKHMQKKAAEEKMDAAQRLELRAVSQGPRPIQETRIDLGAEINGVTKTD